MKLTVDGVPAPKGSLLPVTRGGRTVLVEDNKKTDPWRKRIARAGEIALERYGAFLGPVAVGLSFTLPRPKSVKLEQREWPHVHGAGDIDKLSRLVLDGLEDSELYSNDSQVVHLTATKCYPDTPGAVDRLPRPGVIIRIEALTSRD